MGNGDPRFFSTQYLTTNQRTNEFAADSLDKEVEGGTTIQPTKPWHESGWTNNTKATGIPFYKGGNGINPVAGGPGQAPLGHPYGQNTMFNGGQVSTENPALLSSQAFGASQNNLPPHVHNPKNVRGGTHGAYKHLHDETVVPTYRSVDKSMIPNFRSSWSLGRGIHDGEENGRVASGTQAKLLGLDDAPLGTLKNYGTKRAVSIPNVLRF